MKAKLSKDEEKLYGDRCPSGFKKQKLLGKGGCAVVWQGQDTSTGVQVALKQVSRKSQGAMDSSRREVYFGNLISRSAHPYSESFTKLLASLSGKSDHWTVHELGGCSLSKSLFTVKGEFVRGERIYNIVHLPLYQRFKTTFFEHFLRKSLEALDLLSALAIVHSDLKPDNILVNERDLSIKIVDLGSAYSFSSSGNMSITTPEYMPPEALSVTQYPGDHIKTLREFTHPWSTDIWSLGMICLEIITGVPLWMSLKSKVLRFGRWANCKGLLAAPAKDSNTIIRMQRDIVRDIGDAFRKFAAFDPGPECLDLVARMLEWDPLDRISPRDALNHPFINS